MRLDQVLFTVHIMHVGRRRLHIFLSLILANPLSQLRLTPPVSSMDGPRPVKLTSQRLPLWLRLRIFVGRVRYGEDQVMGGAGQVLHLSSSRLVKLRCHPNELQAMEFVRKNTAVSVPKVYEVYEYDGAQHLVMERVAGNRCTDDFSAMTPEQLKNFGMELAGHLQQMRSLKPPAQGFVGPLSLGSNLDHRLSGTRFGPFEKLADFHTYLRFGRPLEHWADRPWVMKVHSRPETYTTKFTHADLRPNNIMVKEGNITAIIDWEFAGWYPEYWEYTKMYFGELRPRWDNFYKAIEEGGIRKYPDEKEAELEIWRRMGPFTYDDPQWKPGDDERALEERLRGEEDDRIRRGEAAGELTVGGNGAAKAEETEGGEKAPDSPKDK